MSPIPARSPYQAGDRIQLHGDRRHTGFRGVVEGSLGSTVLHGTTDTGQQWIEHWGVLQKDGEPNLSACRCTCCPGGKPSLTGRNAP